MSGRINSIMGSMLIGGFAILFAADIVYLAMGYRAAVFGLFVLLAAAWGAFHLFTAIIPPVRLEQGVPDPPPGVPESLFAADSPAVLIDAPGQGAGWINTLRHWAGPVARADAETLDGVDDRLIVAVPQQAAHALTNTDLFKKLERAAEHGAAVIVDNPGPEAARVLGLELADDTVSGRITWVDSNALGVQPAQQIADSPLCLCVRRIVNMPGVFADWMRCAEYPAVITKPHGRGVFIVTLFSWAETLTELRQGVEPALTAAAAYTPARRVPARMRANELPLADLLDVFLLGLTRRYAPVCGWWRAPDAAPGVFLVTADDDCAGARTTVVLETAGSACAPAVFLLPGQGTAEAMPARGWAAGVLWNRFPLHSWRGRLIKNSAPSVAEQIQTLERGENAPPAVARIHRQRLDGGLDHVFGALQSGGAHADATFGPGPGQQGYMFATGFPFYPQSSLGGAFAVLEAPYQVHDRSGAPAREWRDALIERMAAPPHSPVTLALQPFNLLQNGRMREAAALMIRAARDSGFAMPDMPEWIRFWNARAQSAISASMEDGALTLRIRAACGGMALDAPAAFRGKARKTVAIDGQTLSADKIKGNAVPVPQGDHVIEISYEK